MNGARPLRLTSAALVAFAFATICAGSPCWAQSEIDAESAIRHAVQLRREHRDAEALAEFEGIAWLWPTPRVRAQIAMAEQALGRWKVAEEDLQTALSAGADDPWIVENLAALQSAGATIASHLATLRAYSNISGARLRVNGDDAVSLPSVVRVEPGKVILQVSLPGTAPLERELKIAAGETLDEEFTFVEPPAAAASAPPSPSRALTSPRGLEPAPRVGPGGSAAPGASRSSDRRSWGWAALGTAVAPLTLGIVESVVRESHAHIYNDDSRCPPPMRDLVCGDQRTAVDTATVLSAVGYSSAVTLALAGALLAFVPAGVAPRPSAWIAPHGTGAALLWSF